MIQKVKDHLSSLNDINKQRQQWLKFSALIFLAAIGVIVGWNFLTQIHTAILWWAFISTALTVCMVWWYWTMGIIRKLMSHQKESLSIITELIIEIKEIKVDVKHLFEKE